MEQDKPDPKQALLDALSKSDKANSDLNKNSQNLVDSSRLQLDINAHLKEAVKEVPETAVPAQVWNLMTISVTAQTSSADIANKQLAETKLVTWTTGANMSSAATFSAAISSWGAHGGANSVGRDSGISAASEGGAYPGVAKLQAAVQSVIAARESLPEVLGLINRLGVDAPHPGSRSTADHLEQAFMTLTRPGGAETSPAAVLLDVREGVHVLLDRLLKRFPSERTPKGVAAKVALIGRKAGFQIAGESFFERHGDTLEQLIGDLDKAKGAAMPRQKILAKFKEAMFALAIFLRALDPTRLN